MVTEKLILSKFLYLVCVGIICVLRVMSAHEVIIQLENWSKEPIQLKERCLIGLSSLN